MDGPSSPAPPEPFVSAPPTASSARPWPRWALLLLVALLAIGFGLRLRQYLANRSLYIDEAALAQSILTQPWSGFERPLSVGDQVAPVGFQWLQKAVARVFGSGELSLRLWPVLASLLGLLIFARLCRWVLAPPAALFAVALFAFNERLIFHGTEMKQYSSDVLGSVVLLALAAGVLGRGIPSVRSAIAIGLAAAFCCWLSFTAFIVLGGAGLAVAGILGVERRHTDLRRLAAGGLAAAALAAPAALGAMRQVTSTNKEGLLIYWTNGVPPHGAGLWGLARWALVALRAAVSYLFRLHPNEANLLFMISVLLGVLSSAWILKRFGLVLVAVVGAAFLAGATHEYPFSRRLVLFLVPPMLVLSAQGVCALAAGRDRALRWFGAGVAAYLVAVSAWYTVRAIPEYRVELRTVLESVKASAKPGDGMYVYYESFHAYRYYQSRLQIPFGPVVYGHCRRDQWPLYLDDLGPLVGKERVWVLFSQMADQAEVDFLLATLDSLGPRLTETHAKGAFAVLWDLRNGSQQDLERIRAALPPEHRASELATACQQGPLRDSGVVPQGAP